MRPIKYMGFGPLTVTVASTEVVVLKVFEVSCRCHYICLHSQSQFSTHVGSYSLVQGG